MADSPLDSQHQRAALAVAAADALLITAGAGMGVDSGLPDFRGPEGFWRAYPAYEALGLRFEEMANPRWFKTDPHLAWGFYGHRMMLYRRTVPHGGFAILRRWASGKAHGGFVFTSNVDSQFQLAGFAEDRLVECHGTLGLLQCAGQCGAGIFPAKGIDVDVDPVSFRAKDPLPKCPKCGGLARPNVLMFGDWEWDGAHTEAQEQRLSAWLESVVRAKGKLAVIELGAGTGVPTVRMASERAARLESATLVRINLREPNVPAGHVGIAQGALAALTAIDERLSTSPSSAP
jgi:NAD-dependent SIR2 family protein deacetylase